MKWRTGSLSIFAILVCYLALNEAQADLRRFARGEAIVVVAVAGDVDDLSFAELSRLSRSSFSSISPEALSKSAVKVSVRRKVTDNKAPNFQPYSVSRDPCNTAPIRRLLRKTKGLICEPNWEGHLINTPNDSLLSSMYSASTSAAGRIYLREAWDLSTGSANNVIGIIDTGIDYNHPDLAANIWVNQSEIPSNGIDDDLNGLIDDLYGYDYFNQDGDPLDDHNHGTAIAGVIGAVGNNARGVPGINWQVKMVGCKAFNSSGSGSLSAVINCINYITALKRDYGVNVVATNNSYGGFPGSTALRDAIIASKYEGIVFVAGAGNYTTDNDSSPFYPASFDIDNIIVTAATDSTGALTSFSNYGASSVDIAAPGISIITTIRNNQYGTYQGTSIAAPHVTGAIALILAHHPGYNYSQAISAIQLSGTVKAGLSSKCSTSAILNVFQALTVQLPNTPTPTATPTATNTSSSTAVATSAPTWTPTPPSQQSPQPTATDVPQPVSSPTTQPTSPPGAQPTSTPSSQPTSAPTSTPTSGPGDEVPADWSSAKIDISVSTPKGADVVRCTVMVLSGELYAGLPGQRVQLAIKGTSKKNYANTNTKGVAKFSIRRGKQLPRTARCSATLINPVTKQSYPIRSKVAALM